MITIKIWEIKQAAQPNTLDMYIYGNVEGDYKDWFSGETIESDTSANHFKNELNKYSDISQINIYINSYGGDVFEGTAIHSQLKRHPAQKTVYVDGFACSVASLIAMAGDKVIMPPNTMMMIHNAWRIVAGNSEELRKSADELDTIMEGNRQAYLQKANGKISEEKLIELLNEGTWLTAKQCLEYGFCDEIAGQDADLNNAKQMLQKVNQSIEQKINYNKAIAAQLREMAEPPKQQIQTPEPEPQQEPPQQNNIKNFLASFKAC